MMSRRSRCAFLLGLALGCTPGDSGEASTSSGPTDDGPDATTRDEPSTGATSVVDTGGTDMPTTSGDSSTTDTPTTDPTMPTTDTGELPPRLCSLEALDPATDPVAAIDEGDGEGQIPTVIGEALLRNCGCHYTDDTPPGFVDYMSNLVPMATHADFHVLFAGVFPTGFENMAVYLAVQERVVNHQPLPMPPLMCQVEGEPGTITMADQALFTDWLAAGAPDGANYP
jgi:hypothetical protein